VDGNQLFTTCGQFVLTFRRHALAATLATQCDSQSRISITAVVPMGMAGDRTRSKLALIGLVCGAVCACGAFALGSNARAQSVYQGTGQTDPWVEIVPREARADATAAAVAAILDPSGNQTEPDWSEASKAPEVGNKALRAAGPRANQPDSPAWSRTDRANGSSAIAIKSDASPFLDARVGANFDVARTPAATMADSLSNKMRVGDAPTNSTGSAWASMTGPGVPHVWDKTAVDVSMDSATDHGRIGTMLSRSVPLADNAYSVTLQNAYRLTQPAPTPLTGVQETRTLEIKRSAKFSVNNTGTSVVAGQTLSSTDEKWLSKVGAEQKLFSDVVVTGTVSETTHGAANKALTAGFKKSW
jgi:hypothetical protein